MSGPFTAFLLSHYYYFMFLISLIDTYRLIKNRESAQKSRLRKKMYIEDLENKVKAVNAQNEQLVQENNALKEEVNYLTRLIKKNPGKAWQQLTNCAALP